MSRCVGRYTGGGSIAAAAGPEQKSTFGVVIDAMGPADAQGFPGQAKAQFRYVDHGAGVVFHVSQITPTDSFYAIGAGPDAAGVQFNGTDSSAAGQGTVTFGISSQDHTDGFGDFDQDSVIVVFLPGPFAGDANGGLVRTVRSSSGPPTEPELALYLN